MSTDVSSNLPRKKRSILWYIAGAFLLLLGLFFFQLLGPNAPIIVSRQTTYLTQPLRPDGLPDYRRYVLERYRNGVTPQNNAATLLWAALWPGELQPGDYGPIAKELGLAGIPNKNESIESFHGKKNNRRVADWLTQRLSAPSSENAAAVTTNDAAANSSIDLDRNSEAQINIEQSTEQVQDFAMSRPWTSQQFPPLAEWIHENSRSLDMLLEGSHRPRCYYPSPSLISEDDTWLVAMMLPGIQGSRETARSLSVRAMWHLGEGRPAEAWQDVLATHRIGRLVAQGQTLVEQLVGLAIEGIALDHTQTLLDDGELAVEQIQQIRRDLAALPPFANMATVIDNSERVMTLESLIRLSAAKDTNWGEILGRDGMDSTGLQVLQIVSVDWNLVLRNMNRWYDRLAAAARLPSRAQRVAAIDKVQSDIQTTYSEAQSPARIVLSAVSRQQRSELVASIMIGIFLPHIEAATTVEDRANAELQLTQLAAALAEHRAVHGAYPEKLDELVPGILDKLPADVYTASPLFYERDDAGYLLYSGGDNGKDDGGSNEMQSILAGRSVYDDGANYDQLQSKIPTGADDISIRVPLPPLKIPILPERSPVQ